MATGTFSIPGVATGMDWGKMVDEIISNSQKAYRPMLNKRDNLERKISVYEEFNQSIRSLQTKLTSLRLPSIYKAKTTEMTRLDSNGLAQSVLTASVTSDAKIMNYDIEVLQKATTMSRYGKTLSGAVGMDSVFYINVGGKRAKINVRATDTLEDIARKINNARDITTPTVSLDVVASVVDGQLVVRSTKTGAGSEGKLSQTVTRSSIGYDTFNFYPDLKNETINGAVVIRRGDDTYYLGRDFDIVGNEIRWRDSDPKAATAGSSYSAGYVTNISTSLQSSAVARAADQNDPAVPRQNAQIDYVTRAGVESYTVTSHGTGMDPDYDDNIFNMFPPDTFKYGINGSDLVFIDSSSNILTFTENVDYEIDGDGIRWLSANRPLFSDSYTVEYTPVHDNISPTFSYDPRDNLVVSDISLTYNYGTDFVIEGNDIRWLNGGSRPAGSYDVIYTPMIDSNVFPSAVTYNSKDHLVVRDNSTSYEYTYGTDFVIEGNDIRWLNGGLRPTGVGATYTVEYTSMYDSIPASGPKLMYDSSGGLGGSIVVRDGSITYEYGVDYTTEGNGIRWLLDRNNPMYPGASYTVDYTPPGDVLIYNVKRSTTGAADPMVDRGIFSQHTFMYDSYGNVVLPGEFVVVAKDSLGNIYGTYIQGKDFIVEGDGIRWLSANRPPDHATYTIEYTPAAGEVWLLPAVTRNPVDIPDYNSGFAQIESVSPSGVKTITPNASLQYSSYMQGNGTAVITQGIKTWVEGVDFDIVSDGTPFNQVVVKWRAEAGASAPEPGSSYDLKLNYTTTSGANTTTHTYTNRLERSDSDTFNVNNSGIPFKYAPTGTLDGKIYMGNGLIYGVQGETFDPGEGVLENSYSVSSSGDWPYSSYTITWEPPTEAPRLRTGLPQHGDTYTIEYTGNMNMFSFEDNGDGILGLLGFDGIHSDPRDTDAQDAQISINGGGIMTYATNTISFTDKDTVFDDEGNVVSLLGLTLNIKGPGKVQLDVTQDAEKSVMALQDYIESYNELMDWINVKISEKAVDDTKKATLSGDDFRMRWGLLYGDRLLSGTKNKLRELTSFANTIAFQSRTGREVLYGTLGDAGYRGDGFFTVRLGGAKSTVTIDIRNPDGSSKREEANVGGFAVQVFLSENDTLQSAANKINEALKYNYTSDELGVPYYTSVPVYSADGSTIIGYENKLVTPSQEIVMGTATVRNGRIVLSSAFNQIGQEIPLMVQDSSGLLRYLGLNDRYTMLSQVGISTGTSSGSIGTNAKTGFLEFDVEKYMEALSTDPDAVADLMVSSMKEMDKYLSSLSSSAQAEFAPGVVGIQGRVSSAIDQLRQEIVGINRYLANADKRLEAKADSLYRSFSAAETALGKLSQQAAWLASVTNVLSGNNNN